MKKYLLITLLFIFCTISGVTASAQNTFPAENLPATITAPWTFNDPTGLGPMTIPLPPASTYTNKVITVSNGSSSSDCTAGSGSNYVLCVSNGSIWESLSGLTGAAGATGSISATTGPSPWYDMSAFAHACPSTTVLTGSINSGSSTLALTSSDASYANGCEIWIPNAGALSTIGAASGVTVVPHDPTGTHTTTYNYKVVPVDIFHGPGTASAAATTTTGMATLSKDQYNLFSGTLPANSETYLVYSDKGLGGAYSCIGSGTAAAAYPGFAFEDTGNYTNPFPCPSWAPATPPVANGYQGLDAIISSGGGTTSLSLSAGFVTPLPGAHSVSGVSVYLDNELAMGEAQGAWCNGGAIGTVLMPYGTWNFWYFTARTGCLSYNIHLAGNLQMIDNPADIYSGSSLVGDAISGEGSGLFGYGLSSRISCYGCSTVLNLRQNSNTVGVSIQSVQGDAIQIMDNASGVNLDCFNIGMNAHAAGTGIRLIGSIIGATIGWNSKCGNTIVASSDAGGAESIILDHSTNGTINSCCIKIGNTNLKYHGIKIQCPATCTNSDQTITVDMSGATASENILDSDGFIRYDPGNATEGLLTLNGLHIHNVDVDPDAQNPPCFGQIGLSLSGGGSAGTITEDGLNTCPSTAGFGGESAVNIIATSLLDGPGPVTKTTATSVSVVNYTGTFVNQENTVSAGVTYTLPAPNTGEKYCFVNGASAGANLPDTGQLTLQTNTSGIYIFYNGVRSMSGGLIASSGQAGDAGCVTAIDFNDWVFTPIEGAWLINGSGSAIGNVNALGLFLYGNSSGTISVLPQSNSGTYNFNMPTTAGTSGQYLTSAGGGSSPMTWSTPFNPAVPGTIGGTTPAVVNGTNGIFSGAVTGTTKDGIYNFNQAAQSQVVVSATEYYITHSDLDMPATYTTAIGAGTTLVWHIAMTKTAAGTGTFQILLKDGTNGSTADTTDATITIGTQSAAADDLDFDLIITFTSTTAYYYSLIPHQAAATTTGFGLAYPATAAQFSGTVTGLTTTTASNKYGVSFVATTGTPTIVVNQVQEQAFGVN